MIKVERILSLVLTILLIAGIGICEGANEMRVVNVGDFGALPDDRKDDTAAVLAALDACRGDGPVTLVFPKGRYDFSAGSNPQNETVLFPLRKFNDLTIDGGGSQFFIQGITALFTVTECERFSLKNVIIDRDRPPFSEGTVIAAEGNHFDVKILPEYPVKGGEPVGAFMDYDPETRLPMKRGLDEYYTVTSTELLETQVLRVNLKHEARIKPGVLAVLRHQVYDRHVFNARQCIDLKVQDVTVHSASGMAFVVNGCTNLEFLRCKVVPRPGSGHPVSATADAMHLSGNRGTVTIRDCEFDGMGDDALNLKTGLFLTVKKMEDERTVLAQHNLKIPDPPSPGDVMNTVRNDDLLPFGKAAVKSVELLDEGMHKIVFETELPDELKEGDLLGNITRTAKAHISNCVVRNNRARGFLIQNPDTIVENCTFKNSTSGGVWMLIEAFYFYESISPWNVTIRNNRFENCNYGGPLGEGVIGVLAWNAPGTFAKSPGIFKNIVIEGNTVEQADNSGIFITGADGIVVRNNTLRKVCDRPMRDETDAAIYIQGSRDVLIEGNSIDPKHQGKGFKSAIKLGPGCEEDTIKIKD